MAVSRMAVVQAAAGGEVTCRLGRTFKPLPLCHSAAKWSVLKARFAAEGQRGKGAEFDQQV